jgi:hypothetical protein
MEAAPGRSAEDGRRRRASDSASEKRSYREFESLFLRQLPTVETVAPAKVSRLKPLEIKDFSVLSC